MLKRFIVMLYCFALGCSQVSNNAAKNTSASQEKMDVERQGKNIKSIKLGVYISPGCPHAARAIRNIIPVKKMLGENLEFGLAYVGMLDDAGEIHAAVKKEDVAIAKIQLCVGLVSNLASWLDFLECSYSEAESIKAAASPDDTSWQSCAKTANVNSDEIKECVKTEKVDGLLKASYVSSMENQILGSPSVFVDGELYMGSLSTDELMGFLCFKSQMNETNPEICREYSPPPPVPATLLFDSRCKNKSECLAENEIKLLSALISGFSLEKMDYVTPQGKHLYDLVHRASSIHNLPVLILDRSIDKYKKALLILREYMVEFDKGYFVPIGQSWDPTLEICDNEKDDNDNGLVDCEDDDCKNKFACLVEEKNKLSLFIMSECPFAKMVIPVADDLLDHFGRDNGKIDFSLEFIGSMDDEGNLLSMHGEGEVKENMRYLCAQKMYPEKFKFMQYIKCRADQNKSNRSDGKDACLFKWMNKAKFDKCVDSKRTEDMLKASYKKASRLEVRGSPSWILNNKWPISARSLSQLVKLFCEKNELDACKKIISDEDPSETQNNNLKCQ